MTKRFSERDILYPEKINSHLHNDYIEGALGPSRVFFEAIVIDIDSAGGALQTDPPNPKNSIRARIFTNSKDSMKNEEDLTVYYPLFSHDVMPVKEGEHVYVFFPDIETQTHGVWLGRIVDPKRTEDKNITPGDLKFKQSANLSDFGAQQIIQDTETNASIPEVSSEFAQEPVTQFQHRKGDRILEGSNNALIFLSRDRPSNPESGYMQDAGTIGCIVGRASGSQNVDLKEDKSSVYISMKTDIDQNLSDVLSNVGQSPSEVAAIGIKSDEIRIVARKGMKVVVEGGDIHLEGQNIFVGNSNADTVAMTKKVMKELNDFKNIFSAHIHTTTATVGTGPPGIIAPPQTGLQNSTEETIGSSTVFVKE